MMPLTAFLVLKALQQKSYRLKLLEILLDLQNTKRLTKLDYFILALIIIILFLDYITEKCLY